MKFPVVLASLWEPRKRAPGRRTVARYKGTSVILATI